MTKKNETPAATFPRDFGDLIIAGLNSTYTHEYILGLDPAEKLAALWDAQQLVTQEVGNAVRQMRSPGIRGYGRYAPDSWTPLSDRYTWAEVGAAIGVGASTAQNRYKDVAPRERTR